MKKLLIINQLFWIIGIVSLCLCSCDKDPIFTNGDYQFENRDLTFLENYDGILIHWDSTVNVEQQEAIREIVSSMVLVEGGTFMMGADDSLAADDEAPIHQVELSDYRINKFVITQKQWTAIMEVELYWNAQFGTGDDYPATNMSMGDADMFIERINKLSGLNFRKPTEAEWEYAARGGNKSNGYLYSGSNDPDEVAWHQAISDMLHPVGLLKSNELGLYDMSGNIWEWCEDVYAPYIADSQINPVNTNGVNRVVRGGSYSFESAYSRITQRNQLYPSTHSFVVGLRLAMSNQ